MSGNKLGLRNSLRQRNTHVAELQNGAHMIAQACSPPHRTYNPPLEKNDKTCRGEQNRSIHMIIRFRNRLLAHPVLTLTNSDPRQPSAEQPSLFGLAFRTPSVQPLARWRWRRTSCAAPGDLLRTLLHIEHSRTRFCCVYSSMIVTKRSGGRRQGMGGRGQVHVVCTHRDTHMFARKRQLTKGASGLGCVLPMSPL